LGDFLVKSLLSEKYGKNSLKYKNAM
jgi:hypothetical protein